MEAGPGDPMAPTRAMLAAALGTEAVLVAKRTATLAPLAIKAEADVKIPASNTWGKCKSWVGDRLAAGTVCGMVFSASFGAASCNTSTV